MPSLFHGLRATALASGALVSGALFAAPAALAIPYAPTGHECRLAFSPVNGEGTALQDPLGYRFDTDGDSPNPGSSYATLQDGESDVTLSGVNASDAYDSWGDLMIGNDPAALTSYRDADAQACATDASGRQLTFASVTIDGLQVQRKLFVPATTGSGARFLDSVTNPTGAPITTSVYVGDLTSNALGTLGSDSNTVIRSTSSGDDVIDAGDVWAATSDDRPSGSDPAVASIWGSAGARQPATLVSFGATVGGSPTLDDPISTPLEMDQVGWGWEHITIPAGATYAFASWSLLRADATNSFDSQAPLAQAAAAELQAAGPGRWFANLTPTEIASVRNWAAPAVAGSIAPVTGATTGADTTLTAADVSFGSAAGADQCTAGDLTWDLGDGTTATGSSVTHRFAAGTASVKLTIAAACGGSAVKTASFEVAAPAVVAAAAPAPAAAARCLSSRVFTAHFRILGNRKAKSITIQLDQAKPIRLSKNARKATVDLRGKSSGTSTFTITAITTKGKKLTATRIYHPCSPTQPSDLKTLDLR